MDVPASKRQEVADHLDNALANLGVDRDTLASFKRDYLFFARYDLFNTFDAIARLNIQANKLPPNPHVNLLEERWEIGFRAFCHGRIPKDDLPSQDAAILASSRITWPTSMRSAAKPVASLMRPSS